ncbi:unnamed protein product [Heterobilharzia americana]|nr:unnamed protein product [Heterobilharzia americana]
MNNLVLSLSNDWVEGISNHSIMSKGNEKLNPCDIDEIEVSSDISGKEIKHSNTLGTMESFVAQTYRAKFFGNISVSEPRGDFICERSLGLLKAQLLTSKLHKKRIRIRVDTSGISVLGSRNSTVHHIHNFENITFIWTDPCDLQSCGIIVRQTLLGENTYEFYGYKLYQNTPKLIGALKKYTQIFIYHHPVKKYPILQKIPRIQYLPKPKRKMILI